MLTDNEFPWLRRGSRVAERLAYVTGLVKGTLEGLLGVPLTVTLDANARPSITFQVRLQSAS